VIAPSPSDPWTLPCSGNLEGEGERDGMRDANGNKAGALFAGEAEVPTEGVRRFALALVVGCKAAGVMKTVGWVALASAPRKGDSSCMPNERRRQSLSEAK
jgi:hypothetical protein